MSWPCPLPYISCCHCLTPQTCVCAVSCWCLNAAALYIITAWSQSCCRHPACLHFVSGMVVFMQCLQYQQSMFQFLNMHVWGLMHQNPLPPAADCSDDSLYSVLLQLWRTRTTSTYAGVRDPSVSVSFCLWWTSSRSKAARLWVVSW